MNAIGIIFANLHERNIPELTRSRTVGSVPFGCRYRLIDFTLSNMVNSGLTLYTCTPGGQSRVTVRCEIA